MIPVLCPRSWLKMKLAVLWFKKKKKKKKNEVLSQISRVWFLRTVLFLTYLCPILKTDCTRVHYHCYCYLSMCYVVISFRSLFHLCCFSRLLSFLGVCCCCCCFLSFLVLVWGFCCSSSWKHFHSGVWSCTPCLPWALLKYSLHVLQPSTIVVSFSCSAQLCLD